MKIDKVDILYILMIPVIALFLIGFYLFLGIMTGLVLLYGGLVLLYEWYSKIDFGFDKDYGMDYTKRK
jgi:hypothetical protein